MGYWMRWFAHIHRGGKHAAVLILSAMKSIRLLKRKIPRERLR
ncbi:hypothetical protein U724_04220 [Pseudomonas chlororaphis subsp. aurantiaca PB-St2]|nr:hypothetical protein U724_04220 [Pseudomonas chlororaphis subsp. aurantiaca PB-St2]